MDVVDYAAFKLNNATRTHILYISLFATERWRWPLPLSFTVYLRQLAALAASARAQAASRLGSHPAHAGIRTHFAADRHGQVTSRRAKNTRARAWRHLLRDAYNKAACSAPRVIAQYLPGGKTQRHRAIQRA